MVVDDDLRNLDAARELGFRTAWFSPLASPEAANGHAILRSFEVQTPDPATT
jgi:FMN phosphatase YigB (HAD superfamily)